MFLFPKCKHQVSVSPSIVVFSVVFILFLFFVYQIFNILVLLFLAFIMMTALRPSVEKLHQKLRIPRAISILIVYLLAILAFVSLLALIIPPLLTEAYNLVKTWDLPGLQEEIMNLRFTYSEISSLLSQVGNGANLIFGFISSTFSTVFAFFTLLVMSFYLMLDRPNLHKKIVWFTQSKKYLNKTEKFLDSVEQQLGGWIRGQIILMLVIGVITYTGLSLMRVPYALPLAILAGLLEILPNLGPTISAVPAAIMAFVFLGPIMGLVIIIFYTIVQQLENNLIVPKIMQTNADVNPLIAILTILVGLKLGGVVGALLAVPFYILLRSVYRLYLDVKNGF